MYDDPRHIRAHPIKVRLNDDELALLQAVANFNQRQRAVLARQLILEGLAVLEQRSAGTHGERRGAAGPQEAVCRT